MYKKWISIFCLIFLMVTTVVWAKPDSAYIDNGNGTVTDIETKLMWQQGPAGKMNWYDAMSYCRGLSLAGYKDWRLPTLNELKTLVDSSQTPPKINHMYFPKTVSSFYWSSTTGSTTDAPGTYRAWGVIFLYGYDYYPIKSSSYYVRAVRRGQTGLLGNLAISPLSQMVTKDAGSTIFSVSNTGTGTMPWSAAVTSDSSWLTITSGSIGTDTGTINCSFTANTSTSSRTGTIRVTSTGAKGSPTDVTVIQAATPTPTPTPTPIPTPTPKPTACKATIDGNSLLHIPYLSYIAPGSGTESLWADFVYEFNPMYPMLVLFKLTNYDVITNPSFSCEASTLSDDFKIIHIPDVLFPDGSHLWMDLEYSPAFSTDVNAYFEVKNYGVVSN